MNYHDVVLMILIDTLREHKRLTDALLDSEERWRSITDNMMDVVIQMDINGFLSYVTPSFNKVLGYEIKEIAGQTIFDYIHPDECEDFRTELLKGLRYSESISKRFRCRHADGHYLWMECVGSISRDREGLPKGVVLSSRDITERVHAEDAIKASEEKHRGIIESMKDAYLEVDVKGNITFLNPVVTKFLGYAEEEIVGSNYKDFVDEENAALIFEAFNHLYKSGESARRFDWELIKKDGSKAFVESNVSLMKDHSGKSTGFRGIIRDISRRKQAEELYRNVAEKSFAGVYVAREGKFLFMNAKFASYAGYLKEELIGLNTLSIVYPEDREIVKTCSHKMIKGARTSPYEFRMLCKNGEMKWIMETVTPIYYDGRFAVLSNSMDISDRKNSEEKLRYISTHDTLTGLYNRAFFDEELSRLKNSRAFPISIMMIDVDRLKKVNDLFGHTAGDELLRRAARVLTDAFRTGDIAARIGGDEFAVILPATDERTANRILTRVTNILETHNSEYPGNPLRISLGVATGDKSGNMEETIKEADQRMYKYKQSHQLIVD